jgi:hypothetical protein
MLQGFADDSGSDGIRAPFIIAAYILEAEKWTAFSDEWAAELKRDPAIQYFKMAEASEREKQFAGVAPEIVKYKIRQLLNVIAKHDLDGVYTQLDWNDFRTIFQPEVPEGPLKHPYHTLFPGIIDAIVFYQERKGLFPSKIDLDFDEQGSLGDLALFLYPFLKKHLSPQIQEMLGRTPTMLDDKTVMPLQAADLLAWSLRREFDPEDVGKEWHWLYEEVKKTVCLGARFIPPSFTIAVENMRKW